MARSRPHAPQPSEAHSKLIDSLGGPSVVAEFVSGHLKLDPELAPQTVSQWKKRGIPFAYRACLAIRARDKGIGVPTGFLNEQARG